MTANCDELRKKPIKLAVDNKLFGVYNYNIKKKAVIRNSKRRAKFREKPLAARLHEQSAKAAFELWTESIFCKYTPTVLHRYSELGIRNLVSSAV